MHINNLVLSLALPVASKLIDVAADAAQSLGQNFSHLLADSSTASPAPQASETSIAEELTAHADRLRDFLSAHSVTQGFRIRLEKSPSGEASGGVSGPNAETVASLLQQKPHWMRKLQTIADSAQAVHAVPGANRSPHLNIEISEHGTSHWYVR